MKRLKWPFLRKNKLSIVIISTILVVLCSFIMVFKNRYDNVNLRKELGSQIKSVKFEQSSQRISLKIASLTKYNIKNIEVIIQIVMLYKMAYRLAEDERDESVIIEEWADSLITIYLQGAKDGKKYYDGGV